MRLNKRTVVELTTKFFALVRKARRGQSIEMGQSERAGGQKFKCFNENMYFYPGGFNWLIDKRKVAQKIIELMINKTIYHSFSIFFLLI